MNATERIESGISIRESQVKKWLIQRGFRGEYLLVSTKPDSIYSKKLAELKVNQKLIVDLYTPIFLEKELTLSRWKPQDWLTRFRNKEMVRKFIRRGNHFLVANRRQREYWVETANDLGFPLKANDISVFPTGSGNKFSINDSRLAINDRKVVLWFGGIYPWMDPELLVEAFSLVAPKFPEWKLRFLGGFHPDTGYRKLYQKVELAAKSKISNDQLEFIPWQTEKNLNKYFADVAFAVHLVKNTPEDYYAHRVRILTILNYGIGVLTSGKDVISDLLVELKAGMKVVSMDRLNDLLIKAITDENIKIGWPLNAKKVENYFVKQELDVNYYSNILENIRIKK